MASSNTPNTAPKAPMRLYAELRTGSNNLPGQISAAPVLYNQHEKTEEEKKPVLPFAPSAITQRPQASQRRGQQRPRGGFRPAVTSSSPSTAPVKNSASHAVPSTFEQWANIDTGADEYVPTPRYNNNRRKKRKNRQEEEKPAEIDWDAPYDVAHPNSYADYLASDDYYAMKRAWKRHIKQHRADKDGKEGASSPEEGGERVVAMNPAFAPPANYDPSTAAASAGSPPPPAVQDAATGDEAYENRLRLSQMSVPPPPPPEPEIPASAVIPPPPKTYSATISAAPVRYDVPSPPADTEMNDVHENEQSDKGAEKKPPAPRKGWAMMAKMGYARGKGLGANEDGILDAVRHVQDKAKKLPDAQGGGSQPRAGLGSKQGGPGTGRIVGGKRAGGDGDENETIYGIRSTVVKVWGMLDGLDLAAEMTRDDGGIRQRIGDDFSKRYGKILRLVIDEQSSEEQTPVYVHFGHELSALSFVNGANDDDFRFEGRKIRARFYDEEKFEKGIYE
ncbi:hypothetical protein GQ43DRAFT_471289 [Delitschia confertaspora ATCC 74209]|uniref:G-patch domain-containing protein n=1 Tax=Delitschia confertaspora ATCC 74209 TaxID=1513339 RepID=A0A9P4MSZ7_9PLEO|nr:hypothetical protein GQ43DRAFT_471289 [Delitschia confertaspora ATCC 74209]